MFTKKLRVTREKQNCIQLFQLSPSLAGFLDRMLVLRADERATAVELLRHPFIKLAREPSCLLPLISSKQRR